MDRTVDLKREPGLVAQYVALRNGYAGLLLTAPVTLAETRGWLKRGNVEVWGLAEGRKLLGAAVLYLDRGNEIAFFVREPGKGVGTRLLGVIEDAGRRRGASSLWAWVLRRNVAAQKAFEKAGYSRAGESGRTFEGKAETGVEYRKPLREGTGARKKRGVRHVQDAYGIRPEAKSFPMMCVLSLVYACNARCPNCPYTNSSIRRSYKDALFMDAGTFRRIADECGPHRAWLRLSGGGEPMLHPRAVELIEYAKARGARVGLITNGSRFTAANARRLLAAGVDMVEFSVDAADARTYARVRPGLGWRRLVASVRLMRRLRDRLKAPTKIIASAVNQVGVDADKVAAFWEPLVDEFQKRKYLTWGINDPSKSADPEPYLPPGEPVPCPFLFERLNIDSRGKVMMCGFDIAAVTDMGNIHDRSIKDIWLGPAFSRLRRLHLQGRGMTIALCRDCPDWKYRSWKHNYWKIVRNAEKTRRRRAGAR